MNKDEIRMKTNCKISIIIPVCNSEPYFDRCIQSVIAQSYPNLEIIVVNDGSGGNIDQQIQGYLDSDCRIRYLRHEKNEGLFRARVTGMKAAAGDYVAFLDSDDYISYDYYRTLLRRGETTEADIVIGKTVWEDKNERFVYNFHDSCFQFDLLEGKAVQDTYFSQEASCYSWHTVWNKLYKRELIEKCLPFFDSIRQHIVMTEDICFSSIFFFEAARVSRVSEEAYFYCVNEDASTSTKQITLHKFEKNVADMGLVFDSVDQYLVSHAADEAIRGHFRRARVHYARMWQNLLDTTFTGGEKRAGQEKLCQFCKEIPMEHLSDDFFFESVRTPWKGALEYFKQQIGAGKEQYISFDIFDTLIMRPFYQPEDLFHLLDAKFHRLSGSSVSFAKMRRSGERLAREQHYLKAPAHQDITLSEIYGCIGETYQIEADLIREMQQEENRLEIAFSSVRQSGKSLFDMALASGKTILLITDMYLEPDTIRAILEKNGYAGYSQLYVSCEERKLKYSGDLFRCALRDYPDAAGNLIHIGDTWKSDVEGCEKAGIKHIFLPKASEAFENRIQDCCTNHCASLDSEIAGPAVNVQKANKNLGYRTMKAMAAHRYFDNPYRPFHPGSDMNADPYFIGYYAVGMHLMGLCKWIDREVRRSGCGTLHFLSRDGFLPMRAYEIYRSYSGTNVQLSYLQTSRKALMPLIAKTRENFFQLPVEYRAHTPSTLLSLLSFAAKEVAEGQTERILRSCQLDPHKPISDEKEYTCFVRCFLKHFYSTEKHKAEIDTVKQYFSQVQHGDLTFDMGYSGRIQSAISEACGEGVNVLFLHEDYAESVKMREYSQFSVFSFYDFQPSVTGLFREHILSDCGGSCIGYRKEKEQVTPVIEDESKNVYDCHVVRSIQRGALDFVRDFMSQMNEYMLQMDYSPIEASYPFECFLRKFTASDLQIFRASYFEDEVWGAQKEINIESFIRQQTAELDADVAKAADMSECGVNPQRETLIEVMNRKPKIVRALMWILVDFQQFREKMLKNLKQLFM